MSRPSGVLANPGQSLGAVDSGSGDGLLKWCRLRVSRWRANEISKVVAKSEDHALKVKVAVILPTFNRAHLIANAITSVLAQTFTDYNLIVVDDGSTDNTAEIIRGLSDPHLRYIRQENLGPGPARNRGVLESDSQYVSFLDSDDLWSTEKLASCVEFLDAHAEVNAVFHDLEWRGEGQVQASFVRGHSPAMREWLRGGHYPEGRVMSQRDFYLMLLREVPVKPTALMIRKSAFVRYGGFNAWPSAEDWDLLLRFSRSYDIGYIDSALGVIRLSDDSTHIRAAGENFVRVNELLDRERALIAASHREAMRAVNDGIKANAKAMGWRHLDSGRRLAAARVYFFAFAKTGAGELLLRAARACLPV